MTNNAKPIGLQTNMQETEQSFESFLTPSEQPENEIEEQVNKKEEAFFTITIVLVGSRGYIQQIHVGKNIVREKGWEQYMDRFLKSSETGANKYIASTMILNN